MVNDSQNPHSQSNFIKGIANKIGDANRTSSKPDKDAIIGSIIIDLLTNIGKGILLREMSTRTISVAIATQAKNTHALAVNAKRLLEFINSIPPLD